MLVVSFSCYRLHNFWLRVRCSNFIFLSPTASMEYCSHFPTKLYSCLPLFLFVCICIHRRRNLKQLWQQQQLTRQRWMFAPSMLGMWVFFSCTSCPSAIQACPKHLTNVLQLLSNDYVTKMNSSCCWTFMPAACLCSLVTVTVSSCGWGLWHLMCFEKKNILVP